MRQLCRATPPPNLKVLELDAQAHLNVQEKNKQRLMEITSRGTFLDEEDINRFQIPGMDELIAFLEISRLVKGPMTGLSWIRRRRA